MSFFFIIGLLTQSCFAVCPSFNNQVNMGIIPSVLNETSGIVASRKNTDVLWVHNDSGAAAILYAINRNGILLGTYTISGATNRDWEDISIGPGPDPAKDYIYIGDIGGNIANYGTVKIYRVPEPFVVSNQSPVTMTLGSISLIELSYPNEWHDAETLMVDPWNGDIYIVSKVCQMGTPKLYRAAYPQSTASVTPMEFKRNLPYHFDLTDCAYTGGDISPSGTWVVLRKMDSAKIWRRPLGINLWDAFDYESCSISLDIEGQGEAIGFEGKNRGYFTVAEGSGQEIYYYPRNPLDCSEALEMQLFNSDFNKDCKVNYEDLMILLDEWLTSY